MLKTSSFNIFMTPEVNYPTQIFNTYNKRSFRFREPWDKILDAAMSDTGLRTKLLSADLLTSEPDYQGEIEEYFRKKADEERKTLFVCFTITTECELQCPYCFQRDIKREQTSLRVISHFLDFIEKQLSIQDGINQMYLVLFGGEPLCRPELCIEVLSGVRRVCRRYSIGLDTLMTTNGLIANESSLAELEKEDLKAVQISFDGPRREHNRIRQNSFDRILNNLPAFASHFRLALKYNMTPHNSTSGQFKTFLDDIGAALEGSDYRIILEAIQDTGKHGKKSGNCYAFKSSALAGRFIALSEIAEERRIYHNLGAAFHPPCFFTMENAVMVQPDGSLSCCDTAYDIPEFTMGNVFSKEGLSLGREMVRSCIRKSLSLCEKRRCGFLPLCESGCFYEKYKRRLPFDKNICRREYAEKLVPYLFRLHLSRNRGTER